MEISETDKILQEIMNRLTTLDDEMWITNYTQSLQISDKKGMQYCRIEIIGQYLTLTLQRKCRTMTWDLANPAEFNIDYVVYNICHIVTTERYLQIRLLFHNMRELIGDGF